MKASVRASAAQLEALGAELVEVSCPRFNDGIATYYVIAPSEASANLARYDGVKYGFRAEDAESLASMTSRSRAEGFGAEVQRRILIGTYALSAGYVDAYYKKAQQVRTLIRRDFDAAFQQVDVLLTPTAPSTAFKTGAHADDPLAMYLADLLTIPVNLAGLPAISVPCGFSAAGLPIGMQLIGNVLEEARLLQVAHQYEQAANVLASRPEAALVPEAPRMAVRSGMNAGSCVGAWRGHGFRPLHNHSDYSLLDGASQLRRWWRGQELGMPAIALTDHGVVRRH